MANKKEQKANKIFVRCRSCGFSSVKIEAIKKDFENVEIIESGKYNTSEEILTEQLQYQKRGGLKLNNYIDIFVSENGDVVKLQEYESGMFKGLKDENKKRTEKKV